MPLLLNHVTPFLQIYNPETGDYARFHAGSLQIEADDPNYEVVMAEAQRNPSITIMVSATTCELCGETFTGKAAAASLGKHRKDAHFAEWMADQDARDAARRNVELKRRAPHACDVCRPVQEFGSADDLALHVNVVHLQVNMDEAGNVIGEGSGEGSGSNGGATVSTVVPTATTTS